MTTLCPRCSAPRLGDSPICQVCGLDFRFAGAPPTPPQGQLPPQQPQADATLQPGPEASASPPPASFGQPGVPPSQVAPNVCPRCQAPLFPGYPRCGYCGLDLRAAWGNAAPASGPRRSKLPVVVGLAVVAILVAAGALIFVAAQPHNGSASSPGGTVKATPAAGTPAAGVAITAGAWSGFGASGSSEFGISFSVSGNSLIAVVGAYTDADTNGLSFSCGNVDVTGSSFDTTACVAPDTGDSLHLSGVFVSASQAEGTYDLTASGASHTGTWHAEPMT